MFTLEGLIDLEKKEFFSKKTISRAKTSIGWLTRIDSNGLVLKPEGRYLTPKPYLPLNFQNLDNFEKILIKQVGDNTPLSNNRVCPVDIFSYLKKNEFPRHLGRVYFDEESKNFVPSSHVNSAGIPLLRVYAPDFKSLYKYWRLDETMADKNLFLFEFES